MTKKIYFLMCAMLLSLGASAQRWVKPAAPASTPMQVGRELYLYNTGVEGFYLGANDWETRASFDTTRGYKVTIQQYTLNDQPFDGQSYLIFSYIEEGWNAGNTFCLDVEAPDGLWIDKDPATDDHDKAWTFINQSDKTYRIGLSDKNKTFSEKGGYEDCYLGAHANPTDTKLYLIDLNVEPAANVEWYFVMPDVYENYVAARKQWDAAMALGKSIEEAESVPGVDAATLLNAKNAYNNTSTETEVLVNQKSILDEAIQQAKLDNASLDNPVEILAAQGYGTDFNDGDVKGWTSTTNAQNKQASNGNNAADFEQTGNHYENWHWEPMSPGVISVTANELPVGVYRFEAWAFTDVVGDVYLFAGDAEKKVEFNDKLTEEAKMEIATFVGDGSLKVGMEVKAKGAGWIGFDNAGLYFLGTDADAINYLKEQTLANEPDFFDLCERTVDENYQNARADFESAIDAEVMKTAYPAYSSALKAKVESCAAYEKFYAKYLEAEEFLDTYGASYTGDEMDMLAEYLEADDIEPGDQFPNGSAAYFLNNGTLDAATILAEIEYMTQLRNNAQANSMKDGDDVTGLLKNPHFAEIDGWSKVGLPEWPMGPDDYKLGQAYSIVFDVYQELDGLQNGLYELTLNDFYRPANYGAAEYENFRAYVYLNSDEAKMNTIESGATEELAYSSDYQLSDGTYVPNDVDGAAQAFKDGRYQQKVFGIVYDGKLKIGLRTDVRYEGNWGVWSDFRLTFRAKNVEVTKEVIASTIPNAEELLNNKCGNPELTALSDALSAAREVADADAYDALVALKSAMEDVKACTDTYTKLQQAINNLKTAIDENPTYSKIDDANSLYSEALAAYESGTYDNTAATAKTEELAEMTVAVKLGDAGDEPQDVTSLLINPTFDKDHGNKDEGWIEGWTTSPMNGYKQGTVSYNRTSIDLYQDLKGLPKGRYIVKVYTYYRAGYYDEEAQRIANGEETKLTTLYAETSEGKAETKVKNLIDDADIETFGVNCYTYDDGRHAPDGTTSTVAWFAQGKYLNELQFTVGDDGKARIGLSKTETYANDYEVVGAWELYFLGDNDRTELIVNPDFDKDRGNKDQGWIEGWVTSPMNGYKQGTVSYNRTAIDLYQDLSGLPAGIYEVTVQTYYRAGYYDEEAQRIANGEETKLTMLYAETTTKREETPVMNLIDDADTETFDVNCYTYDDGRHAPDGTSSTVAWFKQGKYLNRLQFEVPADGKVRIGLSKTETYANDYEVVGSWRLYYLGKAAGMKGDVNGDEKVDISDVVAIINQMAGVADWPNANVNGDEKVDISDVVAVINIMAGQQ